MIVRMNRRQVFLRGMKDGVPIALGYFAVAFTLGIHARNAGLSVFEATLSSLLTNASAGEYAAFSLILRAEPEINARCAAVAADAAGAVRDG